MKRNKLWAIPIGLVLAVGVTFAFINATAMSGTYETNEVPRDVISYRNGVYILCCQKSAYGICLSDFIGEHPELEFVSFSCGETGYGEGCLVVTRNKK